MKREEGVKQIIWQKSMMQKALSYFKGDSKRYLTSNKTKAMQQY